MRTEIVPAGTSEQGGGEAVTTLLSCDSVGKRYDTVRGESVEALRDVTFTVAAGDFVSIVGPSGCGKTTLLHILAGLATATTGTISYNEQVVASGPRDDIGMVFQESVLLPWRTVLQNALLPLQVKRRLNENTVARVHELLTLVGLDGFENKYPDELSGGMRQRNAVAAALSTDPALLLLDEPFGALDALTRERMNVDLRTIWSGSGKTVVLITHSIPEAVFLGNRVMVMSPRPGTVKETIDVPLPAERDLGLLSTPEFARLTGHVRESMGLDSKQGAM